ncbi:MAG: hypothetical protein FJ368_05115, partial [Pelagibacterales bacterium]|nr:hypothetical protein [Pelagibacterales bacterium]
NPQFILNELIDFVKIDKNKIINLLNDKFTLSCRSRLDFLAFLTLSQDKTVNWQKDFLGKSDVKKDIENNFILIEAKNNIEEAGLISLIIFDAIVEDKKCAVVSNNDKLVEFLKYKLKSLNLEYNDARNIGISNSNLIKFIISILEILCDDFSSINLSSILKNPIFYNHKQKDLIYKFENEILRQDRINDEISGIRLKLKDLNDENLINFFEEFYEKLDPIQNLSSQVSLSNYVKFLIEVIEKLSSKTWESLLENENAQGEIYEFFESLKKQNEFSVNKDDFLALFKNFIQQVSYFEKSDPSSKIQIVSTIEARLLNYDLMIVASLNEGDFPKVESENWLGKKIRKDLGVDKKLRRIGQNCYDFCNYLSNKKIVLTRSLTYQDSPTSPSPFLLKFETLCKKLEININQGDHYFEIYNSANFSKNLKISQPQPKPEQKNRIKKLAITDISKMLLDPYSIYAKRILKLKELKNFDFEPSYAEFGSFVHKALEEFIKDPQDNFLDKAKIIFKNYFISNRSELIWWPKFEEIFGYFLQQEKQLEVVKNYTELTSNINIKDVTITGKIDRITINQDNSVAIYDYKTGQVPSDKSVFLGIEPQLTISALMLIEGVLEQEIKNLSDKSISSLNYWKVSGSNESKIRKVCDDNEKIKILVSSAKSGLENLVEYFNDQNNSYISAPNPDKYIYNEYSHLARIKEWI